jgi:ADP-ribose pyrophosphatase YjhB (NUDIX family)
VRLVHELVQRLEPGDELERRHLCETSDWLESTDDVYRRLKPDVPERHLVSYVVLMSPRGSTLLVDHSMADLWLPPGGHVEPGEHPAEAARRELKEELSVETTFAPAGWFPSFLTITRTLGGGSHEDVSLWFLLEAREEVRLQPDEREFRATRWWTAEEIAAERRPCFDPHFGRFLAKVGGAGAGHPQP